MLKEKAFSRMEGKNISPYIQKAFKRCDYKFKIGALRMLSENTFTGHWETVVCRLYGKHWEM